MFLRSTRLVPLDRVDLVIYGKTTTYAQAISEYSSFEQSLRSGDWPELERLLAAVTSDRLADYGEGAIGVLEKEIRSGSISGALNIVEGCARLPAWPARQDFCNKVLSRLFVVEELRHSLGQLPPSRLDSLLSGAQPQQRQPILEEYADMFAASPSQIEIADEFAVEAIDVIGK